MLRFNIQYLDNHLSSRKTIKRPKLTPRPSKGRRRIQIRLQISETITPDWSLLFPRLGSVSIFLCGLPVGAVLVGGGVISLPAAPARPQFN